MSNFTEKSLRITITLGASTFGDTGKNQVVIEGLRATADIEKTGMPSLGTATCRIYGLALDTMQQLTMLAWLGMSIVKNSILIEAIDGAETSAAFEGQIINAWPDFQDAPDVFMHIEAQACFFYQVSAPAPDSYKGTVAVSTIMEKLAADAGLTFENNGVTATLNNPYLPGDTVNKARAVARAAGIELFIDDKVLAICPRGTGRAGMRPLISPASGLIGYPQFDRIGVTFTCLYNPAIRFGGLVEVDTIVTPAKGTWAVTSLNHSLSCQMPGGPWQSTIRCTTSGLVPTK